VKLSIPTHRPFKVCFPDGKQGALLKLLYNKRLLFILDGYQPSRKKTQQQEYCHCEPVRKLARQSVSPAAAVLVLFIYTRPPPFKVALPVAKQSAPSQAQTVSSRPFNAALPCGKDGSVFPLQAEETAMLPSPCRGDQRSPAAGQYLPRRCMSQPGEMGQNQNKRPDVTPP